MNDTLILTEKQHNHKYCATRCQNNRYQKQPVFKCIIHEFFEEEHDVHKYYIQQYITIAVAVAIAIARL